MAAPVVGGLRRGRVQSWFFPGLPQMTRRFAGLQMRLCPLSRAQCSSYQQEEIYFFLAAFFLPPFFFADFFALVAIVISLHVELVRAQYIHKLKMASKC
jgi:hypothetical protein